MPQWELGRVAEVCGRCGGTVPEDAQRLVIRPAGLRLVRCAACAGEPVPAVIDGPTEDQAPLRFVFSPRSRDGKLAATGDQG